LWPAAETAILLCDLLQSRSGVPCARHFRVAICNTYSYLKPGGTFRLIVPDFDAQVAAYLSNPEPRALLNFLGYRSLGRKTRPKGIGGWLREYFGNSHHLWIWDYKGIAMELE
jgi:predicted SAM-dependent methyltransferase